MKKTAKIAAMMLLGVALITGCGDKDAGQNPANTKDDSSMAATMEDINETKSVVIRVVTNSGFPNTVTI